MVVRRRLASLLVALVALAGLAVTGATVNATTSDPLGADLMRLTNLDRQALGVSALGIDPVLAGFAHDTAWTCPTNTSMTVHGRASDMATRAYLSHYIKGCKKSDGTEYSSLDIVYVRFGYNTTRGENIAVNSYSDMSWWTTGSVTYDTGCALGTSSWSGGDVAGCPGANTTVIPSVAYAERSFMNSSGHRANILGLYDRFGCGGAVASTSVYYSCVFSLGGPNPLPTPTPTATPAPTAAPTPSPSPTPTSTTDPSPSPTTDPSASPSPSPSPSSATDPVVTTVLADTTRPRVTKETGKWATLARWSGHRFYATASDNNWVRAARVYLDGRRVKTWAWTTHAGSHRLSVWISGWRMSHGWHSLEWKVRDGAGNVSTYADGKVRFYVR